MTDCRLFHSFSIKIQLYLKNTPTFIQETNGVVDLNRLSTTGSQVMLLGSDLLKAPTSFWMQGLVFTKERAQNLGAILVPFSSIKR